MRAIAQRAEVGEVIGVKMRIECRDQFKVEFIHQLQVAVHFFEHRIDDQRFPTATAGQ